MARDPHTKSFTFALFGNVHYASPTSTSTYFTPSLEKSKHGDSTSLLLCFVPMTIKR